VICNSYTPTDNSKELKMIAISIIRYRESTKNKSFARRNGGAKFDVIPPRLIPHKTKRRRNHVVRTTGKLSCSFRSIRPADIPEIHSENEHVSLSLSLLNATLSPGQRTHRELAGETRTLRVSGTKNAYSQMPALRLICWDLSVFNPENRRPSDRPND
jgi:hypothetical protein